LTRTQAKLPSGNFILAELDGARAFERLRVSHFRPGHLTRLREMTMELYSKATSLLLLAFLSPEELDSIMHNDSFEAHGQQWWGSREVLEDFLGEVRTQQFIRLKFPDKKRVPASHLTFAAMAAPIYSESNEVVAAVGAYISWKEPREVQDELLKLCIQ